MAPSKVTDSSLAATWTFSNVVAGQYKFYVTFKAYSLLTNKAPYTIKDGSSTLGSTTVNQKTDPTGNLYDGKNWSLLGMYTVKGPTVSITLSRPQDLTVNGMIADSARIERVTTPTETFGLLPAAEPSGGSTYSVCREGFTLVKGSNYPYITCLAFCRDDICNTAEYYQYSGSTACCRCGPSLWCASSSSRYSTPKSSSSRYSTPGAVSSRSSSASSVVACANEGDMITEANMRPCCSGLISVPFIQPDTSNQCFNMSFNSICTRCGNGQCGTGENFCNCSNDCPRPACGNNQLDAGEQCDGPNIPCQIGQVCTADCTCVPQPPSHIQWETVGDSYLVSTLSDYAIFGHDSYLYLVGGMGFWGPTRDELRSSDGLSWSRVAYLPQSLSNTAYLQSDATALLVGGLINTDSTVHWAFETPNLLTTGFQSNPNYELSSPRSDGALLRVGERTYFLGGYYKSSPLRGFLLGSLLGSLVSQTAVSTPSKEIYLHDETRWTRVQPDLPFAVTQDDAFTVGNRLFIMDRSTPRKVYMSMTGTSWAQVATLPAVTAKTGFLRPLLHQGAIWLIAKSGPIAGSAVTTTDGQQWVTVDGTFPSNLDDFEPNAAVSFKNEIWLLGSVRDYYIGGNSRNGKVLRTGASGGPFCGDGYVLSSEQCDDGNATPSDGCSNCQIDSGWTCTGSPSRCTKITGSSSSAQACAQTGQKVYVSAQFGPTICCSKNAGVKPNSFPVGDMCITSTDESLGTCVDNWWQTCGNGSCGSGEDQCSCPADCSAATCGNGRIDPSEECDPTAESFANQCGQREQCGKDCRCSGVICPVYSPPYCPNGVLVPQLGPDENGCSLPPVCCNGAKNFKAQCSLTLKCGGGSCVISSCTCK